MNYLYIAILFLAILLWFGMRAGQRRAELLRIEMKRPIWNVLHQKGKPCSCAEINRELERVASYPELADVELHPILDEMVKEGTLLSTEHQAVVAGESLVVVRYENAPDRDPPPPPPRPDREGLPRFEDLSPS